MHAGIHPPSRPPREQTSPEPDPLDQSPPDQTPPDQTPPDQTPPDQTPPPQEQTPPPGSRHPPPRKQTPAYGLRAAGTHPTGMHSCYLILSTEQRKLIYYLPKLLYEIICISKDMLAMLRPLKFHVEIPNNYMIIHCK